MMMKSRRRRRSCFRRIEKEIANEKKGGREGEEENEENDIDINEEFWRGSIRSIIGISFIIIRQKRRTK